MAKTTGELDVLIQQVEKKVDSYIEYSQRRDERLFTQLERIEGQTIKTNGRVSALEDWKKYHDNEHAKSLNRIENLEKYLAMGIGGLLVLEIILKYTHIL
jgi:hypothetical protein